MTKRRSTAGDPVNGSKPSRQAIEAANLGADGKGDYVDDERLLDLTLGGATTVNFDIACAQGFLTACENCHPRVKYELGAKCAAGAIPGVDFTALDCSGFVREVVRRATNLGDSFPDGSVIQHEWVQRHGFEPDTAAAAEGNDGVVRIAFLAPTKTRKIGHVLLVYDNQTLESHGGVGPDSRNWNDLTWRSETSVFVLAPSSHQEPGSGIEHDWESKAWLRASPPIASSLLDAVELASPSDRALDLIIYFEVTDQATYERKFAHPTWPGYNSGVTIGIGFDVGQSSISELQSSWTGQISDEMVRALEQAVGIVGKAAEPLAHQLHDFVDVPWPAAIAVFRGKTVAFWSAILERALPNTCDLSPDSYGALLSLTYNRGASYTKPGGRYTEMRAILECMASRTFADIPAQLRAMKRLWPQSSGLWERRDMEADLFEAGLSEMPKEPH